MDKEKGPQVRVVQGTEHPAFLQLFNGSMIVMYGKSDNNEISKCKNGKFIINTCTNACTIPVFNCGEIIF